MKNKTTIFIMLAALLLFIILTALVLIEHGPTHAFNHAIYAQIATLINPTLTTIATCIGSLTHWYSYTPIILILLIIPTTRTKIGLPIAATLAASAITGPLILKNILAIERPNINQLIDVGGFGYPSGHSINAAAFFGICTVMMLRYAANKSLKVCFTAFALVSILLVGLSRIYLGVHTVTDVIGGYLAGCVVICAAILIEDHMRERKAR